MLISSGTSSWLATSWFEWMQPNSDLPVTNIDSSILPLASWLWMSAGGVRPSSCMPFQ